MNYFQFYNNCQFCLDFWNNSQYDLCDIVLSLTDNNISCGVKIYALFCRKEVLNLMQYYVCDFIKIKRELGIMKDYVERKENLYSKDFNPKRNRNSLTLSRAEMKVKAKECYRCLLLDLENIAKSISKT